MLRAIPSQTRSQEEQTPSYLHNSRPPQDKSTTKPTMSYDHVPGKGCLKLAYCSTRGRIRFRTTQRRFQGCLSTPIWLAPDDIPTTCFYGTNFSVEHALSCVKGGFPSIRHNEIRDFTANLMSEVCHNVATEPHIKPITVETLSGASANKQDGARLDIAADGFWGSRFERAFFDVRVFNPYAPSNRQTQLYTTYRNHEKIKKRVYDQRIREIEHATFTPLVLSSTGGLGQATTTTYKRLASLLSTKRKQTYSTTMGWIRCRLSFSLLHSAIMCIRGAQSSLGHAIRHQNTPIDLVTSESQVPQQA